MTNDFKKQTLDYITGNLTIESSGSNSFRNSNTLQNNLTTALQEAGVAIELIGTSIKALTSDTTSNYILYGDYGSVSNKHGFIVVCNQEGSVEKVFTAFDSGTLLSQIMTLNYAEDGNIYGVDWVYTDNDILPRVILLNNVALKTSSGYSCKLRASYYYPSEYQYFMQPYETQGEGTSFIKKVNDEATYFIVGSYNDHVCLLKFVINVGSTNEWTLIQGSSDTYPIYTTDFIIEKVSDTPVIHLYYQPDAVNHTLCYDYYNGTTLTRQNTYNIGITAKDIRIKSSTEVYISGSSTSNDTTTLNLYELNNGVFSSIYSYSVPETFNYPFLLNYINNILFGTAYVVDDGTYGIICLAYDGNETVVSDFIEKDQYVYIHPCIIQNTYALYKFIMQDENTVHQQSIVIYGNSYSGESYSNYNSLVALHGELYTGNDIIFARGLYNKSTLNNTTTSILEVPFNYINNISIDKQDLLSVTQLKIISNTNSITKNIYENLFINFINTINVIDEDTGDVYPSSAIRINNSINTGTQLDYEGEQITKVRINTENNQVVQNIEWTNIDNTHRETTITIYIDSTPYTIEFMNNDGTFTYLEKDISNLEVGKLYNITQKIRMEG